MSQSAYGRHAEVLDFGVVYYVANVGMLQDKEVLKKAPSDVSRAKKLSSYFCCHPLHNHCIPSGHVVRDTDILMFKADHACLLINPSFSLQAFIVQETESLT